MKTVGVLLALIVALTVQTSLSGLTMTGARRIWTAESVFVSASRYSAWLSAVARVRICHGDSAVCRLSANV